MPNVNVATVISEQQQVINSALGPVEKPSESTIKPNVNVENVNIPSPLVVTSSTLPILTTKPTPPPSTAIVVQPQQNLFEMIMQFLSHFLGK